jgi:hypothetical protein
VPRQKKPKRLERDIRASIKQFLDLHKIWHFHNLQTLGCYRGLPDITAVTQGKVWAIEVKTDTGRQSKAQIEFQKRWEARGHTYILARCAEDVAEAMGVEI